MKQELLKNEIIDNSKEIRGIEKSLNSLKKNKLTDTESEMLKILKGFINIEKKSKESFKLLTDDMNESKTKIEKLERNTDVICSPFHSKRMSNLRNLCKQRVWKLLNNDKNSPEYVLFSSFFFKNIYGDLASYFSLDTWYDISMVNYEKDDSMYNQAKEFAECWRPTNWYVHKCIDDMILKRDNGILKPERCRALTGYLKSTNNGEINPFS